MATCSGNVIQRTVNLQLAYKLARLSDARVWDVATGKLAASPLTHEDWCSASSSAPTAAGCSRSAATTRPASDPAPYRLLDPVLPHAHAVSHAVFSSPDGRAVVTAGGHDIHTGDPRT